MKKELSKDSLCCDCQHLDKENGIYCCPAFPPFAPYNGIPEKYLSGKAKHTKADKDQLTKGMVFELKDDFDML